MVHYLEKNHDIGAVGPCLFNEDGTVQLAGARHNMSVCTELIHLLPFSSRLPRFLNYWEMGWWDHTSSRDVEAISGACIVVRRNLLGRTILNEDYFMYGEDLELCWHIRRNACKRIFYLAEAHVLHYGQQSSKQAVKLRVEERYSAYLLLRNTRGAAAANTVRFVTLVASLLRLPWAFLVWVIRGSPAYQKQMFELVRIIAWTIGLEHEVGKTKDR